MPHFCALPVGNVALGRHLYNQPATDVLRLLTKPGDSADEAQLKELIARMLARNVNDRILIDEVVSRLSELRTRLGTQVLVAVDNIWDTPVFFRKS